MPEQTFEEFFAQMDAEAKTVFEQAIASSTFNSEIRDALLVRGHKGQTPRYAMEWARMVIFYCEQAGKSQLRAGLIAANADLRQVSELLAES